LKYFAKILLIFHKLKHFFKIIKLIQKRLLSLQINNYFYHETQVFDNHIVNRFTFYNGGST